MSVCFLKERCVILIVLSGVLFQHLEIVVVIFVDPDYCISMEFPGDT